MEFRIALPLYLLAREESPNAATGLSVFKGFHMRPAVNADGESSLCVVVATSIEDLQAYAVTRPSLAAARVFTVATALDLEVLIADLREHGATHVAFNPAAPGPIIRLADFAAVLDAAGRV